jgi:hypothetical protein
LLLLTYKTQRHVTLYHVSPERVHKYHFISLCNVTLQAEADAAAARSPMQILADETARLRSNAQKNMAGTTDAVHKRDDDDDADVDNDTDTDGDGGGDEGNNDDVVISSDLGSDGGDSVTSASSMSSSRAGGGVASRLQRMKENLQLKLMTRERE